MGIRVGCSSRPLSLGWGLPLLRILGCEESLVLGDLEKQL